MQHTPHGRYRIGRHGGGYHLATLIADTWRPLYTFADEPRPPIDLQVGSWYASTYPGSVMVNQLIAARIVDGARWNLSGADLVVHRPGAPSHRERLDDADAVLEVLREGFGIDLAGLDVRDRIAGLLRAAGGGALGTVRIE